MVVPSLVTFMVILITLGGAQEVLSHVVIDCPPVVENIFFSIAEKSH